MLFQDLRVSLKEKIAPGYVFVGSDIFLVNKSIDLVLSACNIDRLGVINMDEGVGVDQINASLMNVSMFGSGNAVLIRGEKTYLYLKSTNPKDIVEIDCNPMSESLVVRMIMQNKEFDLALATKLARICDNNFSHVSNEVEKLLSYGDVTAIDQIVTKTEKYQIYELSNAMLKRDPRSGLILETLLQSGIDDYAVFSSLLFFVRRLWYTKSSDKTDADLAKVLGCNPYAITALRRDSKHISKDKANDMYKRALLLEYQIKSGKIFANRAVTILMGEFV